MAGVPEKVLNWLYSVLTSEYKDVNRTYHDAAEALSNYPSLSPRTEVYTHENGASALLLLLSGTLPVTFRGATYGFPVAVWVPHAYPREPPMVYVQPSQDMVVRPGQHVSGDGKIYHPYLAQWAQYWDKSTLFDFMAVLRGVFAKEPPVRSRQQQQQQQYTPAQQAPPPVPPPPAEWRRSAQGSTSSPAPSQGQAPPPRPPKPGETPQPAEDRYSRPPPLPPHPPQQSPASSRYQAPPPRSSYDGPPSWQQPGHSLMQNGQRQPGYEVRPQSGTGPPPRPPVQTQGYPPNQYGPGSPVSPMTPQDQRTQSRYTQPPQQRQQQPQGPPVQQQQYQQSQQYSQPQPQGSYQQAPPPGYSHQPQPLPTHYQHQIPPLRQQLQQQHPPAPQPPINLMDDSLEVTLPSQSSSHVPFPVPPVPPNPEKDALLHALSQALVAQTTQILQSNTAALTPLQSQQQALQNAYARLQQESAELSALDAALASNEKILQGAMIEADRVMSDAKRRKVPDVDDVLVAPTVVGGQLYVLAAEEKGIGDALFVLGRALDGGRVGVEGFVKQTRSLAREQFLKKALIKKIAKGMALDEYQMR